MELSSQHLYCNLSGWGNAALRSDAPLNVWVGSADLTSLPLLQPGKLLDSVSPPRLLLSMPLHMCCALLTIQPTDKTVPGSVGAMQSVLLASHFLQRTASGVKYKPLEETVFALTTASVSTGPRSTGSCALGPCNGYHQPKQVDHTNQLTGVIISSGDVVIVHSYQLCNTTLPSSNLLNIKYHLPEKFSSTKCEMGSFTWVKCTLL